MEPELHLTLQWGCDMDQESKDGLKEGVCMWVGGVTGSWGGANAGLVVGSAIGGPPGAFVGLLVGWMAGSLAGMLTTRDTATAVTRVITVAGGLFGPESTPCTPELTKRK